MILDERLKLAHCHPVFSLLMIDCGTAVWPTVERVSRQRLPPTRGCWRHRLPRLGNLIRHRDKWVRQPWYDGHIITFALAVRFNLFSMCVFFLSTGHEGEKTPVSCGTAEDLPDYLTWDWICSVSGFVIYVILPDLEEIHLSLRCLGFRVWLTVEVQLQNIYI